MWKLRNGDVQIFGEWMVTQHISYEWKHDIFYKTKETLSLTSHKLVTEKGKHFM